MGDSTNTTQPEAAPPPIRALEFFCGIGGLHYGLQLSQTPLSDQVQTPPTNGNNSIKVVAAFDINHVTNNVYKHNFGNPPIQTAIEKLSPKDLDKYNANTWLLSPPCQPFTRGGKKLDDLDARSKGLLHLIGVLPKLERPPKWILLENVLNFEVSRSRDLLVRCLEGMGYEFEEWLLSPLQFGIPNDRKRYYLTARRRESGASESSEKELKKDTETTKEETENGDDEEDDATNDKEKEEAPPLDLKTEWNYPVPVTREISYYLDPGLKGKIGGSTPHMPSSDKSAAARIPKDADACNDVEALKIPEAFVKKRKFISDGYVVGPAEKKSACFTKAYGHHGIGAGSFLMTKGFDVEKGSEMPEEAVETYGLRFFSPTEVARLHGFPVPDTVDRTLLEQDGFRTFTFPQETTLIQRYRVLGNSLNVVVVGELLRRRVFCE